MGLNLKLYEFWKPNARELFCFLPRMWYVLYVIPRLVSKSYPCAVTEALYRPYGRRGSRGIALLFHDHGTRRGWGVSVTPWPLFTPGKDPVPIVQEAGWASGPVWTGAENLTPTRIRSPDPPARSQSLYRICYPTHTEANSAYIIQRHIHTCKHL